MFNAEFCDKTFLLIMLFVFCWTNMQPSEITAPEQDSDSNSDSEGDTVEKTMKTFQENLITFAVSPVRIFIAAEIGTVLLLIVTLIKMENFYANASRMSTSITLVGALLFYTYEMLGVHLQALGMIDRRFDAQHKKSKNKLYGSALRDAIQE